jgi:hypothetical protein
MDSSTGSEKNSDRNNTIQTDLESSSDIAKAGHFKWSTRQTIAAVSLSILWVGELTPYSIREYSAHVRSQARRFLYISPEEYCHTWQLI